MIRTGATNGSISVYICGKNYVFKDQGRNLTISIMKDDSHIESIEFIDYSYDPVTKENHYPLIDVQIFNRTYRAKARKLYPFFNNSNCIEKIDCDLLDNTIELPDIGILQLSSCNLEYFSEQDNNNLKKISFNANGQNIVICGQKVNIKEFVSFYPNCSLKCTKLAGYYEIDVDYDGENYRLPFKPDDLIYFDENGKVSKKCIEESQERLLIVQRTESKIMRSKIEDLEGKDKEKRESIDYLRKKTKVTTTTDILLILVLFVLSGICFSWGLSKLSEIEFGGGEFIEYDDYNRYTFLYEILKRMPAIILFVVAFKFLQLAFERIRFVGEVERVQKYIKLTNDDTTKNKLLKIIALPFFTKKKMKSSVVAKLQDRRSSVALEGKEETH